MSYELGERHFEVPPLPVGYKEPSRNGSYFPFEATPLNVYDPRVIKHQRTVEKRMRQLINSPPEGSEVSPVVQEAIALNYHATTARLAIANLEVYDPAQLQVDIGDDEYLLRLLDNAVIGTAAPSDLLELLDSTSMKSVELAKLTHPYCYRMDALPQMRLLIDAAIGFGGLNPKDVDEPYRKVKLWPLADAHGHPSVEVFVATWKRTVGQYGDATVVERQTAAVRTDKQFGFDHHILDQMRGYRATQDHERDWGVFYDQTGCREFVTLAVQSEATDPFMIPLSTEVYAFKDEANEDARSKAGTYVTGMTVGVDYYLHDDQ